MSSWVMSIPPFFDQINGLFWVITNILVGFTMVVLVIFVVIYYALFDPRATTAGKFVFRFMLALVGVIGLSVVGIFLDPEHGRNWTQKPVDVLWWRPFIRMIVYGYVAYSVSALAVLVVIRKWWPEKIHTSKTREMLKTRH